jgi:hypothetical protein
MLFCSIARWRVNDMLRISGRGSPGAATHRLPRRSV